MRRAGSLLLSIPRRRPAAPSLRPLRPLCTPAGSGGNSSASPPPTDKEGSESGGLLSRLTKPQAGAQKLTEKLAKGVGWREALSVGIYERKMAERDAMVVERLAALADMPAFTFADQEEEFAKALYEMDEGITTAQRVRLFADKMQGGNVSDTVEKRKEDTRLRLSIIREFNEHERRNPKLLCRKAREAIARKLGIETKWVEDVIFQFHLQYAQWTFLRRERLRNRPIPTTSEELETRLRLKPTREFIEVMNIFRKLKQEHEESRPSYEPPPRDMHVSSKRTPLKIRPYISSSRRDAERRKSPPKPYKRHRASRLL